MRAGLLPCVSSAANTRPPSTYYDQLNREPTRRQMRDEELKPEIARVPSPNSGERCDNVHRLQTKHLCAQALPAKGVAGSAWLSAGGVHREPG